MAAYDYRCRTCDSLFEVHRPITADVGAVRCPGGHDEVTRVWSAVALGTGTATLAAPPAPAQGGGCCGGSCGCAN